MDDARKDAKKTLRRFERSIQQLVQLDAGAHMVDADRPMHAFNNALLDTASQPVECDDQLQILLKGIAYLLKAEIDAPQGSVDDVMTTALGKAIAEAQSPLDAALLALARHTIKAKRPDLMRA